MSLFEQFILSFQSYFKAIKFINQHKLWAWLMIPGIINLVLFIAVGITAWNYSGDLTNYFVLLFNLDNEIGITILFWVTLILIRLLVLFIFFFIYRYIILILMSPALALFTEKIHTIQTGREIPFVWKTFVKNIFRGIGLAIKNLLKEAVLSILVILLNFTGVLVPLVPVLLFIIQSYFYGFSMMDYKNELRGLNLKESSQYVWKYKGLALGNGVVFNFLLLIPFFGALLAPMLALLSTCISMKNKKG